MKNASPAKKNKTNGYFWVFGGLLCVLLLSIMVRDIDRPFTGLHSWADAHSPWAARVHVKYGLGYTKGFSTRAVGYPPTQKPFRYLDHPQLPSLINAAFMAVLGIHAWSLRAVNVAATMITLLLFLKILRRLLDQKTAILAGLLFVLFPLIGYFGVNMWLYPMVFFTIWCYLVMIQGLKDGPQPTSLHKWGLAIGLFFSLQMSWEGFFFALAIGVHYVFRCIRRKQLPDKALLAILIIAPLSSLLIDFTIMAAGHGWDYQKIIDLYKWRAGPGEMQKHDWAKWFLQIWKHAVTNFSLPVLIISIAYLTVGQLFVFTTDTAKKASAAVRRRFPQFWLFLMPAVFQLFLLKGCLWKHETWEKPLIPLVAISAALGIMLTADVLNRIRPLLAKISMAVLIGLIAVLCTTGLNHYHSIRHFSPAKVKLFTMLREKIPPEKALLSPMLPVEGLIAHQHKAKGAFYRPEVAWYLDREIFQARTISEIQEKAKTGRFPYYLVPYYQETVPLINQLRKRYKFESLVGDPGGKGLAPMLPYLIFDLRSNASASK